MQDYEPQELTLLYQDDPIVDEHVTAKGIVHELLEQYPASRDSDSLLYILYLEEYHNLKRVSNQEDSYMAFRKLFLSPEVFAVSTIIRCRAKLQNEHEHLRGESWEDRKRRGEAAKEHYGKVDKTFPQEV